MDTSPQNYGTECIICRVESFVLTEDFITIVREEQFFGVKYGTLNVYMNTKYTHKLLLLNFIDFQ